MSKVREVRSFEYVNQPYDRVRGALLADPLGTFRTATRAAADRAHAVAASLRASVGPIDLGAEIDITLGETAEGPVETGRAPWLRLTVSWEAVRAPRLFPLMHGTLSAYPLTSTETQLDFEGTYEPPLGAVGGAFDAVVGHRIAEASVHRFVGDVAHHLRGVLGG